MSVRGVQATVMPMLSVSIPSEPTSATVGRAIREMAGSALV